MLSYKVRRSSLCPQPLQSAPSQIPNTMQTCLPQPEHRQRCDSRGAEQNTCSESLSWAIIRWQPMAGTGLSFHLWGTNVATRGQAPSWFYTQGTEKPQLMGRWQGLIPCFKCPNSPWNLLVPVKHRTSRCPTCSTRALLFSRQHIFASSWGGTWSVEDNKLAVTAASQPRGTPQHSHHPAQRHPLPQESLRSQLPLSRWPHSPLPPRKPLPQVNSTTITALREGKFKNCGLFNSHIVLLFGIEDQQTLQPTIQHTLPSPAPSSPHLKALTIPKSHQFCCLTTLSCTVNTSSTSSLLSHWCWS